MLGMRKLPQIIRLRKGWDEQILYNDMAHLKVQSWFIENKTFCHDIIMQQKHNHALFSVVYVIVDCSRFQVKFC